MFCSYLDTCISIWIINGRQKHKSFSSNMPPIACASHSSAVASSSEAVPEDMFLPINDKNNLSNLYRNYEGESRPNRTSSDEVAKLHPHGNVGR